MRKLSFTNKGDEGKEEAVLGVLFAGKIDDKTKIELTNNSITFGSIKLV